MQEPYIGKDVRKNYLNQAMSDVFEPEEELVCVVRGMLGRRSNKKSGMLLITNRRVVFYQPKVFGGFNHTVFPYDQISGVNFYKSFLIDKLELVVGSNKFLVDTIRKGDGAPAIQFIEEMRRRNAELKSQAAAKGRPTIDIADQIEKLGALREKGLLSDEEFERKKKELLSRL